MKKKTVLCCSLLIASFILGVTFCVSFGNNSFFNMVTGADDPLTLNLNRSLTENEISNGQATFATNKDNAITFKFTEASSSSGLISLATGGSFYNDTKVTGMTKLEIALTSGSAIVSYGNGKDAVYVGSAKIEGTAPITVAFTTPSDYFRISNVNGPLDISNIKITYYCSNTYDPDIHEGAEEFTTSSAWADGLPNHYFVEPADEVVIDMQQTIAFDVKFISTSGQLSFYLNEYFYGKYCGQFSLNTAGALTGTGATFRPLDDNWYRITINLASTTKSNPVPDYVSRVNLVGTNANGYIKYMGVVTPDPDIHDGAEGFNSSSAWVDGVPNHYFVTPSNSKLIDPATDVVVFDVKFRSTTGQLNFYLNEYYYGRWCGPFTLTTAGKLTGAGATLTETEDNWYRITIDLASTAKSNPVPAYVSRVNLASTTADGFIKYIHGFHYGADEFTSSSAWADGVANHYFVTPTSAAIIDLTKTIAFDVKFTSDSGQLNFYLNQYNTGRWCGPFTLTTAGALSGAGASVNSLGDGWYRITINLAAAAKSGSNVEFVSRVNLVSTSANGSIKFAGIIS